MRLSEKTVGLICGSVAAAAYGMNPLFVMPLYEHGMSTVLVLFYRFVLAALMLVPILVIKGCSFKLKWGEAWSLVLGGALMVASSLCLYSSFKYMDIGLAMTLLFLYPVIVAVIMGVFFREKISWSIAISIVLALLGLVFVTILGKDSDVGKINITWTGVGFSIASSFAYASYIVAVRKSPMNAVCSEKLTFYTVLFGAPFFLIFLRCGLDFQLVGGVIPWLCLLGMAFIPTIIALAFMAISIEKIGATPTAILGVLEPVTGLLIGILLYNERLTVYSSMGILMIFAAVMLVIIAEHRKSIVQR